MNPKVRKARRDVERAEKKAAELAAEIKKLKYERQKLEDAEIARRVRSAAARDGADIDAVLDELLPEAGAARTAPTKPGSGVSADGKDA